MGYKRRFSTNGYQHLYQISVDGSLLFCTTADKLLLYTLIMVKSVLYGITITQLCIMYNHFHIQAKVLGRNTMDEFMSAVTWTYATMFNHHYGLKGHVFHRPYGNAPKVKPQKIKENMFYIAANPIGKKAVDDAGNFRWNFLKYAPTLPQNPYSDPIDPATLSDDLRKLMKKVKDMHRDMAYIDYRFFNLTKGLNRKEQQQLTDYIISTYNVIDYTPIIEKFGSIDGYLKALREVEGSEYDLNDDLETEDYKHYDRMIAIAAEEGYDMRYKRYDTRTVPEELFRCLSYRFINEVGATPTELRKFFKKSTSDSANC